MTRRASSFFCVHNRFPLQGLRIDNAYNGDITGRWIIPIQHERGLLAPDHVNDIADSCLTGSVAGDQQPFFLPVDDLPNDEQLDSAQRRRLDRTHHGADNFADIHAYTS